MNIPREFIDLLLAKIDLVDLINAQIPLRKKSSNNYFACCPFHNEKSASFSVSQTKQFYYCFGCGAHGNAIDFMMQHDRLTFPEAIESLARQVGMEIPRSAQPNTKDDSLLNLYDLTTNVCAYYYDQMRKSQRAINYLKNRGIVGMIAQQFMLGYAPSGFQHLIDHFGKTQSDKKKLLDVGLIIKKTEGGFYDRFRDRIIFPIHDNRGRIIGFGGRIIDQGEPKYLNSPETILFQKGHELYGLYHVIKKNRKITRIMIVEGYMDVIALFQHGITYAVATLGTATTTHHIQRLLRYTAEIIFCFDGDIAGRTAAWRALQVLFPIMQDSLQVRFLFLPEGDDPDSLINKEGKINFEKRITNALPLSGYFFQKIAQECDLNTLEGRARFASSALEFIKQLPQGLFQGILIDELAKRARVDVKELKQQLPHQKQIAEREVIIETRKNKLAQPVHLAMALLVQHPPLATLLKDPLPTSDLPGYDFLTQLIEFIQNNPRITSVSLLEYWRDQKERVFMAKLLSWEHMIPNEGVQNEFLGAIRQLILLGFDNEINRLLSKAAQTGLSDDEKLKLSDCINKKKNLANSLHNAE